MNIFDRIIILFRIDKILDSARRYMESREKREDIEKIRYYKKMANFERAMGHNKVAKHLEKKAKITKERRD